MAPRTPLFVLLLLLSTLLSGCPDTPDDDDITDDDDTTSDDDDSASDDDDSASDDDDSASDDDDSTSDDDDSASDDDDSTSDDDDSAGDDDDSAGDDDDSAGDDDDSTNPVACTLAGSLSCPDVPVVQGNNSDQSNISLYDTWGCFTDPLTGPEVIYEYIASSTTSLAVSLSGLNADLDLVVLQTTCEPASCVTSSNTGGTNTESILLPVVAGEAYYFVVDGWNGATSDFELDLGCASAGDDDDSAGDDDDSAGWNPALCSAIESVDCTSSSEILGNNSNPGSTQDIDSYGCDPAIDETGPEYVFSYSVAEDTPVSVELTGLFDDLDLFVLEASPTGECDPDTCIAFSASLGDESASFTALAGLTYYLSVDGHLGATSDFVLSLDCPTCLDSEELDCLSAPTDSSNNGAAGSTDQVSEYGCLPGIPETGPEVVYEFVAPVAGNYTFQLSGLTADLDLFLLDGGSESTCDPANCVDSSTLSGISDESVSVTANQDGDTAYLVVDGVSGAVGDYTITAFCPAGLVEPNAANITCVADTAIDDSASGSASVDDWCGLGLNGWTGSELIYSFTPSATGDYDLSLSFGSGDLFLGVLSNSAVVGVADSGDCLAWSDLSGPATGESALFSAVGGETYYFVVDGWAGDSSLFTLAVSCPTCADGSSLDCGDFDSWSNTATGNSNLFDNYIGCPGYLSDGPEYIYVYTASADQDVTLDLTGLSDDLDLYVLEALTNGDCDAAQCVASSILAGVADDSVTFPVTEGTTYYISVDGFGGATSSYTIGLSCTPP